MKRTPMSPIHPFHDRARKCPARDLGRARKLLADAGHATGIAFELMLANNPQQRRVAEVIQGMAREAAFTIALRPTEFASQLSQQDAGAYQASLIGWSGRVDPDANIHQFQTCKGSLNVNLFCDEAVDQALNRGREASDGKERTDLYRQAIDRMTGVHRGIVYPS